MSIFRSLNLHCLLNNYLITAAPVREIDTRRMRSCSRQPLPGARLAATLTSHVDEVKPVSRWSWARHMSLGRPETRVSGEGSRVSWQTLQFSGISISTQ